MNDTPSTQSAFTKPTVGIGVYVDVMVAVVVNVGVPAYGVGVRVIEAVGDAVGGAAAFACEASAYISAPCQFIAISFEAYESCTSCQYTLPAALRLAHSKQYPRNLCRWNLRPGSPATGWLCYRLPSACHAGSWEGWNLCL